MNVQKLSSIPLQKRPLYLGVAPMIPITHPFRKVREEDGPPS